MKIVRLPSDEYYLQRDRHPVFVWIPKAKEAGGVINLGSMTTFVPKELIGKRIMFKVEVIKDGRKK